MSWIFEGMQVKEVTMPFQHTTKPCQQRGLSLKRGTKHIPHVMHTERVHPEARDRLWTTSECHPGA